MKYRREIDGLRSVAVLPVILFHAGFSIFSGGYVGVDVFFVISGYLITSILIGELERGEFSIVRFYERRARRILPALFFVMLACLPFAYMWMLPTQLEDFAQSLIAVVFFGSNILFWRESGYFAADAELKPLLHTWSLAVEEQYYLLFPLFLLVAWRFGRHRVFWSVIALAVLSLLLSEWGWRNEPTANFYLAPTRAWELLAGSVCAFLTVGKAQRSSNLLSAAGLALIVFAIFAYDETTPFPSVYALVPVTGTALIILFASQATWVARLLSLRGFVGIGLISYSAYLWHQPLFAFARLRNFTEPSQALMMLLAATSLLLAWATWIFVETPFRTGQKTVLTTRRNIFAASGAFGAVFVAIGLVGHFESGFPNRFPDVTMREKEISDLKQGRFAAIRVGECQFNERFGEISDFIENWDCFPDLAGEDKKIAVYGDSHAADKAASLRQNAYSVTHLGGAGCPLIYSTQPAYCNQLLDLFLTKGLRQDDVVVLARRFTEPEVSKTYLKSVLEFWGSTGNDVVLFSPMPEFSDLDLVYPAFGLQAVRMMQPDRDVIDQFWTSLSTLDLPQNVRVVDTEALFCGLTDSGCSPVKNGNLLLVDYGHLSPFGALSIGDIVHQSIDPR